MLIPTAVWAGIPYGPRRQGTVTRRPVIGITTSAETGGSPEIGYDTAIDATSPVRSLGVYDFQPAAARERMTATVAEWVRESFVGPAR